MLFGSDAMQEAHRRQFEQDFPDNVSYRNASDDWHGVPLSGPGSRELLPVSAVMKWAQMRSNFSMYGKHLLAGYQCY